MSEWFKRFFGVGGATDGSASSKYRHFEVEHYPLTNAYFVKYKGKYLRRAYITGMVELVNHSDESMGIFYATKFNREADAWSFVDLFIEQRHKDGVTVLRR